MDFYFFHLLPADWLGFDILMAQNNTVKNYLCNTYNKI